MFMVSGSALDLRLAIAGSFPAVGCQVQPWPSF